MSTSSSAVWSIIEGDPALEAEVTLLLDTAQGFAAAKLLAVACFAWLIYDHLTTIDQEFEFFWSGQWSPTRILYFTNRYLPISIFIIQLIYFFDGALSIDFCDKAVKAITITEIVGVLVCEVILVVRVYYLWTGMRWMQSLVIFVSVASLAIALGYASKSVEDLSALRLPEPFDQGCMDQGNGKYLPIFIPVLILSTFLFFMTVARIFHTLRLGNNSSLTHRLLRDGALFHFVVVTSISLSVAGSINVNSLQFSIPTLLSNFLYTSHSVCASHLILSIHSLAADLGDDAIFLLSNVEMSRVKWRKGIKMNELVVEIDNRDSDIEASDGLVDIHPLDSRRDSSKGLIQTSRVGMFEPSPEQFGPGYESPEDWRHKISVDFDLL